MTKRLISLMLCLLFVSAAFVGCGDGGDATTQGGGTTGGGDATGGTTTEAPDVTTSISGKFSILIAGEQAEDSIDPVTGVKIKGWKSLCKEFEDQNPGVELSFAEVPWSDYAAKLVTATQSGEFDVVHLAAGMNTAEGVAGRIVSLNSYIESDDSFDPIAIYGEAWNNNALITVGEYYGLPKLGYTFTHLYNKQILDDFGVEKYPDENTTWEEILEIAKKCTGDNPRTGQRTYGIFMRGGGTTFLEQCANYAGRSSYYVDWPDDSGKNREDPFTADLSKMTFNIAGNEAILKGLEWMKEAHTYSPPGWLTNEGMENFFTENADIAMWMDTDGGGMPKALFDAGETDLLANYKFFPVPAFSDADQGGKTARSTGNFHTWGIPIAAKNKDASWEIVKFLASEYISKQAYDQKWLTPIFPSATEWLDPLDPYSSVCIEYLSETMIYPLTQHTSAYATYNNFIIDLFAQYALGNVTDTAAELERIQKEMDTWRDTAVANGTR